MGGDLVSYTTLLDILDRGQAEMFSWGHVTEERGAMVRCRCGGPDCARDVVVARENVGDERPEHVERSAVAELDLLLDVHLDLVERDVPGALDHGLDPHVPGPVDQLAQRLQLSELGLVGGVGQAPGSEPVAQRMRHVVLLHDRADLVEQLVEGVLTVMMNHPLGQ